MEGSRSVEEEVDGRSGCCVSLSYSLSGVLFIYTLLLFCYIIIYIVNWGKSG